MAETDRSRRPLLAVLATVAGVAALLLTGCAADSPGRETGVSVQDVWDDAARLDGQRVTVGSTVQRVIGPRALVLGAGGVDPLLVLHDGSARPAPGEPVQVTGTVRQALDLAGVVPNFDPLLARDIYETPGAEPYLDGSSITPVPPG